MAGASKDGQGQETAEAAAPFVRAAAADPADPFGMAEWMKNMSSLPLHPVMARPSAAVAAATALGFGLSSHIAGIMFGAMQGAVGAMQGAVGAMQKGISMSEQGAASAPSAGQARKAAEQAPVAPRRAEAPRKPRTAAKPSASAAKRREADDLKRISGIGPKLEHVLNGKGIRRFADIAALSKADVARLDAELGLGGRIVRDDWVGQAKVLRGA
ncbi:NADH:ubiquinone oxidoreductase [Sinorhizobium numidicum]|uniref:NADH:ubiquinone oxidoreductase n=1 Tax=Sinorhizobium numidicum TaxID=680248 RepID=A0ABY8CX23_9HYPH|nr:NADH:ubiquinone oxidoreductase [Sinorhizobium numidicum]WEX78610.1 NADH:ubiquinone oxidoreductase [Sinorhizobium numidicum]WEX82007.1 NADH:ubiquinone oxidoreductase [Sinorhizobium numidicum]